MDERALPYFLALIAISIWSVVWKGLALWRAANRQDKGWFIVLLILNTAGILEIIYLYVIAKKTPATPTPPPPPSQ